MLEAYPALAAVTKAIDEYLRESHSSYFSDQPVHPVLPLKRSKVLHDNLWGTNRFSWRELALIDSPIIQRLRDIHQVGLALQTYMCARHSRFEHSIGVVTIASRVFEALQRRQGGELSMIAQALYPMENTSQTILRFKEEMRLAALLHDTGHSLYSHTSERIYSQLPMIQKATEDLSRFVGKEKGAGEVLAFCLALSKPVSQLLERAGQRLIGDVTSDDYEGPVSMINVALLIVGRGPHRAITQRIESGERRQGPRVVPTGVGLRRREHGSDRCWRHFGYRDGRYFGDTVGAQVGKRAAGKRG